LHVTKDLQSGFPAALALHQAGQAVASLLETHRRTFEVEELENRIEALESQQCAAR